MVDGGNEIDEGVDEIMESMGKGKIVLNIGNGIKKKEKIENVKSMIERVRGGK